MSGSRMKVAGRFKPCAHMGCFDLDIFVEMNQRSRKVRDRDRQICFFYFFFRNICVSEQPLYFFLQWQCPICLKNYCLENVIIDPYFNRITSLVMNFVKPAEFY